MKTWLACAVTAVGLGVLGGCAELSFTPTGYLALNVGVQEAPFKPINATPTVLERLDALEDSDLSGSDPNQRSGANCAGGVCAIF